MLLQGKNRQNMMIEGENNLQVVKLFTVSVMIVSSVTIVYRNEWLLEIIIRLCMITNPQCKEEPFSALVPPYIYSLLAGGEEGSEIEELGR